MVFPRNQTTEKIALKKVLKRIFLSSHNKTESIKKQQQQ